MYGGCPSELITRGCGGVFPELRFLREVMDGAHPTGFGRGGGGIG